MSFHRFTTPPPLSPSPKYSSPSSPPRYQPYVASPPSYTSDARADERTLLSRRRHGVVVGSRPRFDWDERHVVKGAVANVELVHQPSQSLPTYERGAVLDGVVTVTSCLSRVVEVSVQLQGRVKCRTLESEERVAFVDVTFPLWSASKQGNRRTAAPAECPFAIPLPLTFHDATTDSEKALPPTFECADATVEYRLIAHVMTKRSCLPMCLSSVRRIVVPFVYRPRVRPPRPALGSHSTLLGTIKSAPEEWSTASLSVSPSKGKTVECELAYPASRCFAPGQRVAMHLQFAGDVASINSLALGCDAWDTAKLPLSPLSRTSTSSQSRPSTAMSQSSSMSWGSGTTAFSMSTLVNQQAFATPELKVQLSLERRTVIRPSPPPSPTDRPLARSSILATATLSLADVQVSHPGWLALDAVLTVPESEQSVTGFRVGPLTMCDVLALRVGRVEKIVPVVVVGEAWLGDEDEGEPDVQMVT